MINTSVCLLNTVKIFILKSLFEFKMLYAVIEKRFISVQLTIAFILFVSKNIFQLQFND